MEVSAKAKYTKGKLSKFADTFEERLQKTIIQEAAAIKKSFESTVSTWNTQVVFEIREIAPGPGARVFTKNEVYSYVHEGTKPHDIYAQPGGRLFFMTPYGPKTKVGRISAGPGSVGTTQGIATHVHHPGTKARNFNALIKKGATNRYKKRVLTLIKSMAD